MQWQPQIDVERSTPVLAAGDGGVAERTGCLPWRWGGARRRPGWTWTEHAGVGTSRRCSGLAESDSLTFREGQRLGKVDQTDFLRASYGRGPGGSDVLIPGDAQHCPFDMEDSRSRLRVRWNRLSYLNSYYKLQLPNCVQPTTTMELISCSLVQRASRLLVLSRFLTFAPLLVSSR